MEDGYKVKVIDVKKLATGADVTDAVAGADGVDGAAGVAAGADAS